MNVCFIHRGVKQRCIDVMLTCCYLKLKGKKNPNSKLARKHQRHAELMLINFYRRVLIEEVQQTRIPEI
jgi:HSP20 family molecular chaperone IbpA